MIEIDISNSDKIICNNLIVDYNGTLASDGKIIDGVRERLKIISSKLKNLCNYSRYI
jgi:soluble P-type ATPase